MSEDDKAVVRSCLVQVQTGLVEARAVPTFWALLSETRRSEWKLFQATVDMYLKTVGVSVD